MHLQLESFPSAVQQLIAHHVMMHGKVHLRSLRSCSKYWVPFCDFEVTALNLEACSIEPAAEFLIGLPRLKELTVTGSRNVAAPTPGSSSLHGVEASLGTFELTGLHLEKCSGEVAEDQTPKPTVKNLGRLLLRWSNSLTVLQLKNCHLHTADSISLSDSGFFSAFPLLHTLQLDTVRGTPGLTGIDLSGCAKLELVLLRNCGIVTLDVVECTYLQFLYCEENNLRTLDLTACPRLEWLCCDDNRNMEKILLAPAAELHSLECTDNGGHLVISGGAMIATLICDASTMKSMPDEMLFVLQAVITSVEEGA